MQVDVPVDDVVEAVEVGMSVVVDMMGENYKQRVEAKVGIRVSRESRRGKEERSF